MKKQQQKHTIETNSLSLSLYICKYLSMNIPLACCLFLSFASISDTLNGLFLGFVSYANKKAAKNKTNKHNTTRECEWSLLIKMWSMNSAAAAAATK